MRELDVHVSVKATKPHDVNLLVVDGVGSSHLLCDHKPDGDDGSLSVSRNGPHLSHQVHERSATDQGSFVVKLLLHLAEFHLHIRVGGRKCSDVRQDCRGFIPAIFAC